MSLQTFAPLTPLVRMAGRTALVPAAVLCMSTMSHAEDATKQPSKEQLEQFTHERLVDAVLLVDKYFRVEETGQYLDLIHIGDETQPDKTPSSIAATEIGFISLAIGDALGIIDDAEAQVSCTAINDAKTVSKLGIPLMASPSCPVEALSAMHPLKLCNLLGVRSIVSTSSAAFIENVDDDS